MRVDPENNTQLYNPILTAICYNVNGGKKFRLFTDNLMTILLRKRIGIGGPS